MGGGLPGSPKPLNPMARVMWGARCRWVCGVRGCESERARERRSSTNSGCGRGGGVQSARGRGGVIECPQTPCPSTSATPPRSSCRPSDGGRATRSPFFQPTVYSSEYGTGQTDTARFWPWPFRSLNALKLFSLLKVPERCKVVVSSLGIKGHAILLLSLLPSSLKLSDTQVHKSMSLKYEPSSEPLHISAE